MKSAALLVILAVTLASVAARPQRVGPMYNDEAIMEAKSRMLIPQDAQVEVLEGTELLAREGIPGDQPINLSEVLSGLQLPQETIQDLQGRVDRIVRR